MNDRQGLLYHQSKWSLLCWEIKTDFKVTNELEQEEYKKQEGESTSPVMSDLQYQAKIQGEIICYQLQDEHVHISNTYQVHCLQGSSAV